MDTSRLVASGMLVHNAVIVIPSYFNEPFPKMNQPLNPYAAPQSDLSGSPFSDSVKLTLPGLRTTGIGLSLIYYGIVLVLLAMVTIFLGTIFLSFNAARPGTPAPFSSFIVLSMIAGIVIIIGGLLIFVGEIVCLFVPAETGAKGLIITATVLQIAGFFQYLMPLMQRLLPGVQIPFLLQLIFSLSGSLSIIFFVLFLRKVSEFLGRRDFMNRARNILILGAVLVALLGVMVAGIALLKNDAFSFLGIVLLIGALVGFIMYANLINTLSKALLRKEPLGKEPPARKNFLLTPQTGSTRQNDVK